MGRLIDADKFLERVKKDREHESYLHSWTADMVLERLDSWYAPTVEAILKTDYENRLKADLKAILVELQLEIEEIKPLEPTDDEDWQYGCFHGLELMQDKCLKLIQQKIDKLKEDKDENEH